jgi:hypothetical protein
MSHNWAFKDTKLPNYSSWGLLLENYTLGKGINGSWAQKGNGNKPEVKAPQLATHQPVAPHFQSNLKDGEDLFLALRKPLCVGVILGLIPIRGIFGGNTLEFS